ncbi:Cyanate hydratase [Coemansia sp. RSA 2706]|nr:Cyanate hydratase [Coemansia sp. RSA 2711]KAJ1844378.1 Cyanate hydratase [Coemansia sp. RSA 2708]KAJ2304705.1 Cyanate hydratase [Coemansia sp. RSA 2706]KAJ2307287.1 Cyanate hydratase [Coemansia sp. RSA 2705]KAJ2314895.1 Cyanate hydratase [Coemansia sp. RSA 2704]KAJ2325147.1 Cyanate hydratase [Coemansia sp. RSA 2702]KAJ2726196.1 Cyanate hydratase [Coemansia sp. Cherry 401B]
MSHLESLPPACTKLLHEKSRRKLTFAEIAAHLAHDEVWTAALFYGRATPTLKDIHRLASLLNLSAETLEEDFRMAGPPLREVPMQGTVDPIVAPVRDAIGLYAPAIRSVVVEKLGDGAISAPHAKVRVEAGDARDVRIIVESKYVPFQSW